MTNENEEIQPAECDVITVEKIIDDAGKLLKTITMKNGVPDGETIIYDANNQITNKLFYVAGSLEGPAEFYMNSQPLMLATFKNNLLEGGVTLFSNGKKIGETMFVKGLFDGKFTSFNEVGKITRIATYVAGQQNGECVVFYPDGAIMEKSTYKNNALDGEKFMYYPDGETCMEYSTYENGKPIGYIDSYDVDGDLKERKEV